MSTFTLFVLILLAHVTIVTIVALILISFARRPSAFRHAAGVVGLVLATSSPLLVLALPRPAWIQGEASVSTLPAKALSEPAPSDPVISRDDVTFHDRSTSIPRVPPLAPQIPAPNESPESVESTIDVDLAVDPAPVERPATGPVTVRETPTRRADVVASRIPKPNLEVVFNVLCSLWCVGMVFVAFREWRRRRELKVVLRSSEVWKSDRITQIRQEVCSVLSLNELPPIRVSDLAPLPFLVGLRKPIVIMPREIVESASSERLRDVLIHECAHIIRRDSWVHFLQRISAILYWFHPAVHWLNKQIGRAREELCDNFVLRRGDAAEYAETLLELAEHCDGKRLGLSVLGLFSPRWTLEQRIGGILDPQRDTITRTRRATTAVLVILFGSLSLFVGGLGLVGNRVSAEVASIKIKSEQSLPTTRKISIRGKCVDDDGRPVEDARVRVVQDKIRMDPISEPDSDPVTVIAELKSNAVGEFVFNDVEAPPSDPHPQHRKMLYVTATAEGRASALALDSLIMNYVHDRNEFTIGAGDDPFILSKDRQTVSGVVTDPAGQPVAGARVFMGAGFGNPIPGMWSAVTDQAGRYTINDLERWKKTVVEETEPDGSKSTITRRNCAAALNSKILVQHPQFAVTTEVVSEVPKAVDIRLKPAAIVEGKVTDQVTGQPAASVVVLAQGIGRDEFALAKTDASGRYRFQLLKDRYNIWVEAEDRIASVLKAVAAAPDQPVTDADFQLVQGGIVVGTVIDNATNQPLVGSPDKPYIVAHYGPACVRTEKLSWTVGEPGLSIGVQQETRVNSDGRFRLRVAPGRNGVFFIENYGESEQSPQIVTIADGEEKKVELRVTLSVNEKLADGDIGPTTRAVDRWNDAELDAEMEQFLLIRRDIAIEDGQAKAIGGKPAKGPPLTKVPSRERRDSTVNRLLDKFERQSIGNDHFRDPWLRTIKEIVDLGPAAVPELIEELDATKDPWMLQLLGFVLRAIDDRRAVPALIHAIPKTMPSPEPEKRSFTIEEWQMYRHPATTIMLTAIDPGLRTFAQTNQLENYIEESEDDDRQGRYTFDSPAREICGALTKLTGAHNGEEELLKVERYSVTSPDQISVREALFQRVANNWSEWWQQHQNDRFVAASISPDETEAIKAIVRRGGQVTRDGTTPGSPVTRVGFHGEKAVTEDDLNLLKAFPNLHELWTPLNVDPPAGGMKIIGELHSLTDLHLGTTNRVGRSIVGPGLKELRGLSNLKALTLGNITNDDLKEIGQFRGLKKLRIMGASIDDAGLKELTGLENLEEFYVGYQATDVGMADLAALKSLKKLELNYSKITDASLKELKRLTNLEDLDLSNTRIKGVGINELKALAHLTNLNLNGTRVNDAAAKQIAELKSLTALHLTNTKITDDALKQFEQLTNLQYLEIKETEVTNEAARELKKVLPNLSITE